MPKKIIYAEDAIEALTEIENHFVFEDGHDHLLRWAKNTITALPSAQPERTKGHWIDTGSGQECSECGEVQYGYDNFRYYCAKCGSDNRGK